MPPRPKRQKRRQSVSREDKGRKSAKEAPQLPPRPPQIKYEFSLEALDLPADLFEALYGALWQAIRMRDPAWGRQFHLALMEQVMRPSRNVDEIRERLAGFNFIVPKGRPRGSGDVVPPIELLKLYYPLLDRIQSFRQEAKGYAPDTLTALERLYNLWRQDRWRLPPPKRDFPTKSVKVALDTCASPRDMAACMVAAWFGVRDDHIPKYVQRARIALGLPRLTP